MKRLASLIFALLMVILTTSNLYAQVEELDAYWDEVGKTVSEGDFDGYAALYHPDGVLIFEGQGTTMPVSQALEGWEPGFTSTKNGEMSAGVTFRFSKRLNDSTTAFEKGIFRYAFTPTGGEETVQYVHFEALMVKKDGWKMLMEYQQTMATPEEWAEME